MNPHKKTHKKTKPKRINNQYFKINTTPEDQIRYLQFLKHQEATFNIFLIFILYQKKELIIEQLLEKQHQGYSFEPYNDPEIFYQKFDPMIKPLGKLYFINPEKILKISQTKERKPSSCSKKTKKNKKHQKGGYLFMLEDKGDQPITGNDVKKMLDKYSETMDALYYTDFAKDSSVSGSEGEIESDIANPFVGAYLALTLSRKQFQSALTPIFPKIYSIATNPGDWMDYYTLYKLYMPEYTKSEKKNYQKALNNVRNNNPDNKRKEPIPPP